MLKNIFLLILSIFIGAIIIIEGFLWLSARNTQILKIILPKSLFSLETAPTDSLIGKIATLSGKVAWQSRVAPVAILISVPVELQQGEEVDTYEDGSATINFTQFGTISLSSNTQVNLIQTLPENFVINQKQGTAIYTKTGETPTSVVVLDLLVNINSGQNKILVNADTAKITINVITGSTTVAFNDTDNKTTVVLLNSGDEYSFNNNTKIGVIK